MPADGSRYSSKESIVAFGFLVNAMEGGGDRGQSFPRSDAEDLSRGVRYIPGHVTLARRAGKKVDFHSDCTQCCWYWQLPDGSRSYHWEEYSYSLIGHHNHGKDWNRENGLAGPCPHCGNPHTRGGELTAAEVAQLRR